MLTQNYDPKNVTFRKNGNKNWSAIIAEAIFLKYERRQAYIR